MEVWLALTLGTKILNILLLGGGLALLLTIIGVFLKLLGINKFKLKVGESSVEASESKDKKEVIEKPHRRKIDQMTLLNHRFFILLESKTNLYSTSEVNNKSIINNTYIKDCVLSTLYEEIKDYIHKVERTEGECLTDITQTINDSIEHYKTLAEKIVIKLVDGGVLIGIPELYLYKLNVWVDNHISMCITEMQNVANDSNYYSEWKYRASTILEYLFIMVTLIIDDAEKTLGNLNGDLDRVIEEKAIH